MSTTAPLDHHQAREERSDRICEKCGYRMRVVIWRGEVVDEFCACDFLDGWGQS